MRNSKYYLIVKVNKILVSQPQPANGKSPYYDLAHKYGVELIFRPFIKVEGVSARDFRAQKINLPEYTAVIFTAKTAVDHYFRLCEENRFAVPATMKYFCTSDSVANYLQKYIVYRKRKIFASTTGKLDGLQAQLVKNKAEKFLLAVSDVNTGGDAAYLEALKLNFSRAAMYRTVSNDFAPDEPFDYDMLVFFSPQGIESLMKNFPDFKQGNIAVATFGLSATQAAKAAGLRVDIEAPTEKAPSMAAAMAQHLAKTNAPEDSEDDA